jgi:HK97 family phage major capsid protein
MLSNDFLNAIEAKRSAAFAAAEGILLTAKAENRSHLSEGEHRRYEHALADYRGLTERAREYRGELERSRVPEHLGRIGSARQSGAINSAGMLSPLGYTDEQLRRAFDQLNRGETAVLEKRDPGFVTAVPFIPPELGPVLPVFPRHEDRLMDKLPGVGTDVPQLAYIEVVSTTGTAQIVQEGAAKPELLMPASQQVCTARKIAAHVGVSWEQYSGDYDAFVTAVQAELMRCIVDAENLQLYGGTGESNGQVNGLTTNANVLSFTATGTTENFTDIAGGIAQLRSGPALAEPDLILMNPNTWAAIRTQKDQYGRFLATPDPTAETAETVWSVPVVQSTQFTAGQAVLVDSTKYGRVVVREAIVTRIGYSGTDFVQNIVRFVSEERIAQTLERPQAVCIIKGLPTAAPTTAETAKK